jgi:uncharacterized membrane protein
MTPAGATGQTVVRAVLFFSPTCPHCHDVINEDLPRIFDRFGGPPRVWVNEQVPESERSFYYASNGQLEVLLIDASRPAGAALYDQASHQFLVAPQRMGVPRLIVGNSLLVGSAEIPNQFPDLIEQAVSAGGLDWPPIDGLAEQVPHIPIADSAAPSTDSAVTSVQPADSAVGAQSRREDTAPNAGDTLHGAAADTMLSERDTAGPTADPVGPIPQAPDESPAPLVESSLDAVPNEDTGVWSRFGQDPMGNSLSVAVLCVMIVSVYVVFARAPGWRARPSASALLPMLAAVGMVVAGYLSYVETSGVAAVCGPVGDCNTVQQSPYASIVGVPVGILGLVGYAAIVIAWAVGRGTGRLASLSTILQFAMVFIGVLFSTYLTFLEPFVIGATCLWCLSSAVIMTAMLWLVAGPGFRAVAALRGRD